MRAFAYGILDPQGERYRLALLHRSECPACRAYVLSLRGLAAVLPPVPWLVQWTLGAAAGAGTARGPLPGRARASARLLPASSGAGAGALSVSGATGAGAAGAAGGSWWIAGAPLGAKLAASCLLALGVGAGCVALDGHAGHGRVPAERRHAARGARAGGPPRGELAERVAPADGGRRIARGGERRRRRRLLGRYGPHRERGAAAPGVRARAGSRRERERAARIRRAIDARCHGGLRGARPVPAAPPPAGGLELLSGRPRSPGGRGGSRSAGVRARLASGHGRTRGAGAQPRGKTLVSLASASGLPCGRSLPVAIARSGSRRSPTMSTQSW